MFFLDLYLGYILVCTTCVSATKAATRLCTWAGKLWKLVSSPMKPWMKIRSSLRRSVSSFDLVGTSDCVDELRGSLAAREAIPSLAESANIES